METNVIACPHCDEHNENAKVNRFGFYSCDFCFLAFSEMQIIRKPLTDCGAIEKCAWGDQFLMFAN